MRRARAKTRRVCKKKANEATHRATKNNSISVKKWCKITGAKRTNYYRYLKAVQKEAKNTEKELMLVAEIQEFRKELPKLGGRKLLYLLEKKLGKEVVAMGRDKFFELLNNYNLLQARKKRKGHKTTDSAHGFRTYPNLYKDLKITRVHQAWVADITYIATNEGFMYLSLITDVYSRCIIGWCLSDSLETIGCLESLQMAFKTIPKELAVKDLIHHSDRGVQYCSKIYTKLLKEKGIAISTTEGGNCYENALAERLNGILKDEFYLDTIFVSKKAAQSACQNAVQLYNEKRPHFSIQLQFPMEVFKQFFEMAAA